MSENLYEINHLTNDCNGSYLLQNSAPAMTPDYSISSTSSILQSPVSPHINQKHLSSPATPQNELPLLHDITHGGGSWDYNQMEKSASSLWGYTTKDEFTEVMGSHVVYPFSVVSHSNSALPSKFSPSALQRLDSFSKAFPTKNPNIAFSNGEGEKTSMCHQASEILLSPQSRSVSDGSDREPFSPGIQHSQPQQLHNQLPFHAIDSQHMTHNSYQNHQQFHYGYPQHKSQRDCYSEQVHKMMLYKCQSQYHLQQQGMPIHQNQLASYTLAHQKQRGTFIQQTQEGLYGEEQTPFSVVQRLPTHSPQFQDSHHFRSDLNDDYQHQHLNEQTHSSSLKLNTTMAENNMASLDTVPGFSSPKEEFCTDFRRTDLSSSQHQSVGSGFSQSSQSTALRAGNLHHLNTYRQQWAQMRSSDLQDYQILPLYRPETDSSRDQGSNSKLKCVVCNREFKSLPALNGHMRSHGGFRTHLSTFKTVKMGDHQVQLSKEIASNDAMVLPVSVPVKDYQIPSKAPNSLHCHLTQNDVKDSAETCMQLSLPQRNQSCVHMKTAAREGDCDIKKGKKRYRPCLVPLVISPCTADLKSRGPVLFQSRMRSPSSCGDDAPYTPPPMLTPARPGSGLFSNVNAGQHCNGTTTVPQVHLDKDCKVDECDHTSCPGNKSSGMKPRINIGEDFQAEIPDIQSPSKATKDNHKAHLLWTPFHLDAPENQQRVDNLLKMACSSVLPGGGTNTEYALHCLFECKGDVMATLEKLLSLKSLRHITRFDTDYHYAGSDKWTLQEKRQLNKAIIIHNKDFHIIQKMVKTKTVAQCVEYYYTWKERLRLGRRPSTAHVNPGLEKGGDLDEGNTGQQDQGIKIHTEDLNGVEWNQNSLGYFQAEQFRPKPTQQFTPGSVKSSPSNSTTSGDTDSAHIFPCVECGKVFYKVKSRNAHMKTHRQQDDPHLWQLHRLPEQENQTLTPASPSVIPLQLATSHSLPCSSVNVRTLNINDAETLTQSNLLLRSKLKK